MGKRQRLLLGWALAGATLLAPVAFAGVNPAPFVVEDERLSTSPANDDLVYFAVAFSEVVTGVDTSDFGLNTSGTIAGPR